MTWALEFDLVDLAAMGPLRHQPGLDACVVDDRLWLKGGLQDDAFLARLRRLPARCRYTVVAGGALVAEGTLVPRGFLPQGKWLPLHCWLPVAAPTVQVVDQRGQRIQPISLQLVRAEAMGEPNLLRAPLAAWCDYAVQAPQLRLQRWSFAANERGEALIRGLPLPPIPGQQLVEESGIAVEAGWTWSPSLEPEAVRQVLNVDDDQLALLDRCGPGNEIVCELIPSAAFVAATRSAARLTRPGGAT